MKEGLLKGKKGIIFGALNEKSIAWQVAIKAWSKVQSWYLQMPL